MTKSVFDRLFSFASDLAAQGKQLKANDCEAMTRSIELWTDAVEILMMLRASEFEQRPVLLQLAELHGLLAAYFLRKREAALALEHSRDQLAFHREVFGNRSAALLSIYPNLCTAALACNNLDEAKSAALEGLRLSTMFAGQITADILRIYFVLCRVFRRLDQFAEAQKYIDDGIALLDKNPGLLPVPEEQVFRSFATSRVC